MTWRHGILLATVVAILAVAFVFPRMQQDAAYHNLADQRSPIPPSQAQIRAQ